MFQIFSHLVLRQVQVRSEISRDWNRETCCSLTIRSLTKKIAAFVDRCRSRYETIQLDTTFFGGKILLRINQTSPYRQVSSISIELSSVQSCDSNISTFIKYLTKNARPR